MSLDGKQLAMRAGETSQEHDLVSALGKLRIIWELYRPNFGNTIAIQTGELLCSVLRATLYKASDAFPARLQLITVYAFTSPLAYACCAPLLSLFAPRLLPTALHLPVQSLAPSL